MMPSPFQTLLKATLEHLEGLQIAGIRSVPVDPALLQELTAAGSQRTRFSPRTFVPSANRPSAAPVSVPVLVPTSSPVPTGIHSLPSAPGEPGSSPPSPSPVVPSQATRSLATVVPPAPEFQGAPPADREAAMEAIRQRALACVLCPHLVRSRTQVVFGVGSVTAELMFVGEAPGADEDRQGEPFVGPAGQLLTRIIGAMGYSRSTVYIANILKCRPDLPPGAWGNRAPRPEEMETCKPYLLSQVEIIRPKVIVALGLTAVQGLLGLRTTMGAVRGRWHAFRGIPVMPTFHPSYLLRSEDARDKGFSEKRKTWEDMLLVLARLEKPISEKMRGYFLRPAGNG